MHGFAAATRVIQTEFAKSQKHLCKGAAVDIPKRCKAAEFHVLGPSDGRRERFRFQFKSESGKYGCQPGQRDLIGPGTRTTRCRVISIDRRCFVEVAHFGKTVHLLPLWSVQGAEEASKRLRNGFAIVRNGFAKRVSARLSVPSAATTLRQPQSSLIPRVAVFGDNPRRLKIVFVPPKAA